MSNSPFATLPQPQNSQDPFVFHSYLLIQKFDRFPGETFLAAFKEDEFQNLYFLKRFPFYTKEASQAFFAQIPALIKIAHPNIPPFLHVDQSQGFGYIVSPYINGRSLRWVLKQCQKRHIPIPLAMVLFLMHEIANALSFAAEEDILQARPCKDDFFLLYDGTLQFTGFSPKIPDAENSLANTTQEGVPSISNPSRFAEDPFELVSFCALLFYEICTGTQNLPELPEKPPDDLRHVRIPEVPDILAPCLFRSFSKNPALRFSTIRALTDELKILLDRVSPSYQPSRLGEYLHAQFFAEIKADHQEITRVLQQDLGALYQAIFSAEKEGKNQASLSRTGLLGSGVIGGQNSISSDPYSLLDQKIGERYRIKKLLGIGGMGWVYEAEHIEIGKPFALKILHRNLCTNPEVVTRFRREARSASKIGHPNIVDVTDFGSIPDGSVYFVMELLQGIDLAELLKKEGRLSEERVIHIGIQICRALEAAHQAKIIHRDMKPANVLLVEREGEKDFVKLLDFGIAKFTGLDDAQISLTRPGMTMGTPQYMAPEQAAGNPLSAKADIYALGSILYEILTGVPPFTGASVMEVLTQKLTQFPPPLSKHVPEVRFHPALEKLIFSCLARKAESRPASCAEIEAQLFTISDSLHDPEARAAKPWEETIALAKTRRSKKGIWALAGVLVFFLLLLFLYQNGTFSIIKRVLFPLKAVELDQNVFNDDKTLLQADEKELSSIPVATLDRIELLAKTEALLEAGALLSPKENCALFYLEEMLRRFPEEEDVQTLKVNFIEKLFLHTQKLLKSKKRKRAEEALDILTRLGADKDLIAQQYQTIEKITASVEDQRAERREREKKARQEVATGKALLKKGNIRGAKESFSKALSLSPKNTGALLGFARVVFQEGKYNIAIRNARSILKENPNHIEALIILGDASYRSYDYKGALAAYQKALANAPGSIAAARGERAAKKALNLP